MAQIKTEKEQGGETVISKDHTLILYNDDFNTFEHVIDSLIKICGHSKEQAEQCTFLVHYKGKCDVKKGNLKVLRFMHAALSEKGLTADILE